MTGFDIWNELGNIYFKAGAFDDAIDAYNKALELDERIGWLHSNMGFAYANKGDLDRAILMYEKSLTLLTEDKDKAISWGRLGEAYLQLDRCGEAAVAYQKAVELDPENVSLTAGLADAQKRMDSPVSQAEQAEPMAAAEEIAEAISPDPLEAMEATSPLAMVESEALEVALEPQSLVVDPLPAEDQMGDEDPDGLLEAVLAEQQYEEGTNDTAVDGLVMGIVGDAPNPDPDAEVVPLTDWLPLNPLAYEQPDPATISLPEEAAASPALEENAVAEQPGAVETAVAEAPSLVSEPDDSEQPGLTEPLPIPVLEEEEINAAHVHTLLTEGIEAWRRGELEKASDSLLAALEVARQAGNKWLAALSHNGLALVQTDLGRLEDAIESYTQATQLAPEKIVPWNNIGNLYAKLERNDEAMLAFLKAIEHNPEDFVSWDGLGDIYASAGRQSDAIAAYQLGNVFSKHKRPEDSLAAYHMIFESGLDDVVEKPAGLAWVAEMPEATEQVMVELEAAAPIAEEIVEPLAEMPAEVADVPAESENVEEPVLVAEDAPETTEQVAEPEAAAPIAEEIVEPLAEVSAEIADAPAETENVDEPVLVVEPALEITEQGIVPETAVAAEEIAEPLAEAPVEVADTLSETESVDEPVLVVEIAPETTSDITDVTVEGESEPEAIVAEIPETALESAAAPVEVAEPVAESQAELFAVDEIPALDEAVEAVVISAAPETDDETVVETVEALAPAAVEESSLVIPAVEETVLQADVSPDEEHFSEQIPTSIETDRLASAIAAYQKVTEINPENDRAWDSLGNLYRASEKYDDAIMAFKRAIQLHPGKEVYFYHLGLVYAAERLYEDAIDAFQQVIALNPEYTFAHCALAGYYRKLGREAEAQQHIELALPKMEGEKEYDRACFEAICGNADGALELLKIALEKKQTSIDWVRRDPDLDFIRDDPRFKALINDNPSWSERLAEVFTRPLAWVTPK